MIRPMVIDDVAFIVSQENLIFGHSLGQEMIEKEITEHDFAHYFVLEINKEIKGYIGLWINDDIGQIVNFLVIPSEQHKGYGKIILSHAMDLFKSKNVHVISLEVRASNVKAIKLYQAYGFIESYKRENYYQNEDAIVMIWRDNDAHISGRK